MRPLTDEWADRPSNELPTCRHQPRPLDIAQLAERLGTTDVKRRPVGERRISSLGFHNHFRLDQDTSGELVELAALDAESCAAEGFKTAEICPSCEFWSVAALFVRAQRPFCPSSAAAIGIVREIL
jgi:hypothetical protein